MCRWLWLMFSVGCSFDLRASDAIDAAPIDVVDAAIDAPRPPPACTTNPAYGIAGTHAGHRYYVSTGTMNYDYAVAQCAADGAYLVTIGNAGENTYVDTLLAGMPGWIGFDDLEREGAFRWVSGAPEAFRAFAPTEPNDGGTEDCTVMTPDGSWNDQTCGAAAQVVCECDPDYVAPAVAACHGLAGAAVRDGRDYYVRPTPQEWPAAVADCASIGAYLAVPGDDDENNNIDMLVTGGSWIGYSDHAVEGMFVWVNGAPVGYTRWSTSPPQPTNMPSENCVAIASVVPPGSWDDIDCAAKQRYSCECEPLAR